jgi:hypothetical protein
VELLDESGSVVARKGEDLAEDEVAVDFISPIPRQLKNRGRREATSPAQV